jgi:Tfp pilus assembly protein PilF
MKYFLVVVALLSGCATLVPPGPAPTPGPAPAPLPSPVPAVPSENPAIAGLVDLARADAASGHLSNAAASLERALRIEPRNPRLWQALARVRLQQGEYAQAEGAAARSSSWAGGDGALRTENWRLIAQAREARGDAAGARAALDAAERQR